MAQPQSPGVAPGLSHGAQGLWGQSPGTPPFPGAGGHRVQLPTLSQVWSVAGSPHAWIVPAWGPCASSCRGGGDVTLFIAKSWMGWIPREWGHRDPDNHTGPKEWGSHIPKEPRGMEVPQLWSQENPTSHTGPTVTGIPWGSQSQCLKIMFSQIPLVQQSQ